MKEVRLSPRLVPAPLWGLSGSRLLKASQWKRIRLNALDTAGGACVVCGAARDKGMICDEEWGYTDGVALLTGVRIVCPDCNAVTHIGRTRTDGYYDVARDHMARVNGITPADADERITERFREWRAQSSQTWTIAVAPDVLKRYPELAILVGLTGQPIGAR